MSCVVIVNGVFFVCSSRRRRRDERLVLYEIYIMRSYVFMKIVGISW